MSSKPQRQVYVNGKFVPEMEARLSIFDSALTFGDMVFDTSRTFNHVPFRLRDHLERLYASMRYIEIDCGMTIDEMEEATRRTIEVNLPCFPPSVDFQFMHDVTRGLFEFHGHEYPEELHPNVFISCWPLDRHLARVAPFYHTGINIIIPSQRAIPSQYLDPKVKSRSRLHYQLANLEAARSGPDTYALLLDGDGYIAEGTAYNFFLVRDGELLCPEPRNILCGISRKTVMELAAELGIPCRECNLERYHLVNADEAFLCSTRFCMMPATKIHGRPIKDGLPGRITKRILAAWSQLVGVDIVAQAEHYAELLKA